MKLNSLGKLTVVMAIVVSACGSSSESVDGAGTTLAGRPAPVETAASNSLSADVDLVEWASAVAAAVQELQTARRDAADQFERGWRPGPDELDAQLSLFAADSSALAAFLAELPPAPGNEPLAASYRAFIQRAKELADDADRIAAALDERDAELRPLLEAVDDPASLGHPAIDRIIGDHSLVLDSWRLACFDLQAEVADLIDEPIDCLGIVQATPADVEFSMSCQRGRQFRLSPLRSDPVSVAGRTTG